MCRETCSRFAHLISKVEPRGLIAAVLCCCLQASHVGSAFQLTLNRQPESVRVRIVVLHVTWQCMELLLFVECEALDVWRMCGQKTPLLLEDEVRTQSFVKRKGDDLHNTWKDGNELAQVRTERRVCDKRFVQHMQTLPGCLLSCEFTFFCHFRLCALSAHAYAHTASQARQAANYDSLSSSSVLGWWTAASKNKKPCGLKTCKAYHVKKNQMTGFIEAEVHKRSAPATVLLAFVALRSSVTSVAKA